jgi:hypothetical protein
VLKQSIDTDGPNSVFMKFFDHGGGGGGFENNWAVGKLFFTGVRTIMCSIHNRPAYSSEVHGSRDMGVPELNNAYVDAVVADTLVIWGANPYETQTNHFLHHMVPNLRGDTVNAKRAALGREVVARGRMILADPRMTTTVATARAAAGGHNVLHLWLRPGTDIVLLNAIGRVVQERRWQDQPFIDARTENVDEYRSQSLQMDRPLGEVLAEAEKTTGVPHADIEKAASWIAEPKSDGSRRRTLLHYEKGMIWGLKNYQNITSIVGLALLTGNLGKPGTGCSRLGGHQEGYVRPEYAGPRPAIYIDPLLASGHGRVFWSGAATLRSPPSTPSGCATSSTSAPPSSAGHWTMCTRRRSATRSQPSPLPSTRAGSSSSPRTSTSPGRRRRLMSSFPLRRGVSRRSPRSTANGGCGSTSRSRIRPGRRCPSCCGSWDTTASRRRCVSRAAGCRAPSVSSRAGNPFRTQSGKATFKGARWPDHPAEVQAQIDKYPYFFTNGRINVSWQTMYNDVDMPFQTERVPLPWLEMHPRGTANLLTTPYVDPITTIPYYKGSAVGVRRLGAIPAIKEHLTFVPVIDTAWSGADAGVIGLAGRRCGGSRRGDRWCLRPGRTRVGTAGSG